MGAVDGALFGEEVLGDFVGAEDNEGHLPGLYSDDEPVSFVPCLHLLPWISPG